MRDLRGNSSGGGEDQLMVLRFIVRVHGVTCARAEGEGKQSVSVMVQITVAPGPKRVVWPSEEPDSRAT